MHGTLNQWARYNESVENGPKSWTLVYEQRSSWCSSWAEFAKENWSSAWSEELFLVSLVCWGRRIPLSVSLYFLFIVVFFLLNGVPRVGICPISLSFQLLGVVVRIEKYCSVWHKALNAIVATFPLDASVFSVVFFCFSTFPTPWNDMECRYWWHVASFTLGYILAEEDSPMAEEGFSLGWALGPM